MPHLEFNAYRDWLGLSEVPTDFYGLLGLRPFEPDLETIRKAAHRTTSRVRNIKPGQQIQAWKTLLDQIERAKELLCDPGLKAEYDRQLRSSRDSMAPVVPVSTQGRSESRFDPMAPLDESYTPTPTPPATPSTMSLPPPPEPSNVGQAKESTDGVQAADTHVTAVAPARTSSSARKVHRRRAQRKQRVHTRLVIIVAGMAFVGLAVAFWLTLRLDPWSLRLGIGNQVATRSLADRDDPPAAAAEPEQADLVKLPHATDSAAEANWMTPVPPKTPAAATPPPAATTPEPRAEEMSEAPAAKPVPTVAEQQELLRLLGAAHRALNTKQIERSESLLQQARLIPMNPEGEAMVERLSTLSEYVAEFWNAVNDGLKRVEGSELQLNQSTVFVVEVNSSSIVLRVLGKNRRVARDQLPSGLAIALADQWFDQDSASTKVFKGAYMAVTPRYSAAEVRQIWSEAAREGAQLGDLMKVLDDREMLASSDLLPP